MDASEIIGWCALGECSAALLAYGVWQIWRAVKRGEVRPIRGGEDDEIEDEANAGGFETIKIDITKEDVESGGRSLRMVPVGGTEQFRVDGHGIVHDLELEGRRDGND